MHNDLQFLKTRANFIRFSYIEEMEKHLLAFERAVSNNNIHVRWINGEQELVDFICKSMPKSNYNKICFDIPNVSDASSKTDRVFFCCNLSIQDKTR